MLLLLIRCVCVCACVHAMGRATVALKMYWLSAGSLSNAFLIFEMIMFFGISEGGVDHASCLQVLCAQTLTGS